MIDPSTTVPTQIMIIDDHAMFRAGLIKLLSDFNWIQIMADFGTAEEALTAITTNIPDIIIVDIQLPGISGLEFIKKIKKDQINTKILVLSSHKNPEYLKYVLAQGAMGYIPKDDVFEKITLAISSLIKGKKYISPNLQEDLIQYFLDENRDSHGVLLPEILTKTQLTILRLIVKGFANKVIATKLHISVRTVETHRSHLYKKLNCKNTAQLVTYAVKNKLIQI